MSIYEQIGNLGLTFNDGEDSKSGLDEEAYFIPLSWLKTIAKTKPSNTVESLTEITESHVMIAGKKPIPLTPLFKKSGFKGAYEGEELTKMIKQGPAEFFIPSLTAATIGTMAAIKNYRGIILMKRAGASDFMQIGTQGLPAYAVSGEFDTGTGPTGAVGVKVTFEAYGTVPFYMYKGEVPSDKAPSSAPKGN